MDITNKHDWLLKKALRSVDAMKLWGENPRLNPEEDYHNLNDFAEEITATDADRKDFIGLAKSFVDKGFIPADPIVLWQDASSKKFFVAEGNRRILALKLLRNPLSAPKSIRATFLKLSQEKKDTFSKVPVSIAPTFEDAEWYISQRNSMSSLQRRWSAEQQRRWVNELYEKYKGNIDIIRSKIDLSEYELQKNIRILKLKAYVHEIKDQLTGEEYLKAKSFRFPITNFERFFSSAKVKESWGIEFSDFDVQIKSDRSSFLKAFSAVIKRMILPDGSEGKIDSRSFNNSEDVDEIIKSLPEVTFSKTEEESGNVSENSNATSPDINQLSSEVISDAAQAVPSPTVKDDPFRLKLIHHTYSIASDQARLLDIFNELKKISFSYPNAIAASIRIFLDLAVLNYIQTHNLGADICKENKCILKDVILKKRFEFLKKHFSGKKAETIISKFLNPANQYSLDVLNGYQHGPDNHFISKEFLNRFWDFLLPLIKELVVIHENE